MTSGSATHSAIVSSGLKLDAGSWKTNPMRLRVRAELALADAVHLVPEHLERAAGHLGEARDRATDRGLARPGLADEPEHLAGPDHEVDAVDRTEARPTEATRIDDLEARRLDDRGLRRPSPSGRAAARSAVCAVPCRRTARPRAAPSCSRPAVRRTASARRPASTTLPWYMTATRSARSATTPMLCVISTIAACRTRRGSVAAGRGSRPAP